jgi:hypothetical protein
MGQPAKAARNGARQFVVGSEKIKIVGEESVRLRSRQVPSTPLTEGFGRLSPTPSGIDLIHPLKI